MSTRCNVIVKDKYGESIVFYRHSDGYPEGVKDTLDTYVKWVKEGHIRNDVVQSSGWLIILGTIEYQYSNFKSIKDWFNVSFYAEDSTKPLDLDDKEFSEIAPPSDWKAGAYEITNDIHGDIEHLYLVDLSIPEWKEITIEDGEKILNKGEKI